VRFFEFLVDFKLDILEFEGEFVRPGCVVCESEKLRANGKFQTTLER
jgi:hypothetical protein